jgi:hypothetical protein
VPITRARTISGIPVISASWLPSADGTAIGYDLRVHPIGSTTGDSDALHVQGATNVEIIGEYRALSGNTISIEPGTTYAIEVRATNGAGASAWSLTGIAIVPVLQTRMTTSQATSNGGLKNCGWADQKCGYASGDRARFVVGVESMRAASGRKVGVVLYRKTDDGGYTKVDTLPSLTAGSSRMPLDLANKGSYRLSFVLDATDTATGASANEYFTVS